MPPTSKKGEKQKTKSNKHRNKTITNKIKQEKKKTQISRY